jgi:hypothetical protein
MRKLIALLIFLLVAKNCYADIQRKNKRIDQAYSNEIKLLDIRWENYLPSGSGKVLRYEINIEAKTMPLYYYEVCWITDSGGTATSFNRGIYGVQKKDAQKNNKKFFLSLKDKGIAHKQGMFKYPHGIELAVELDELDIYHGAKQIFWGGFSTLHEVVLLPGKDEDYSNRVLISEKNSSTDGDRDVLIFVGIDSVPEMGISGLHFIRTVKSDGDSDYVGKAFQEHTYFVAGKGLVYLRQVIDGKTSMTWKIVEPE